MFTRKILILAALSFAVLGFVYAGQGCYDGAGNYYPEGSMLDSLIEQNGAIRSIADGKFVCFDGKWEIIGSYPEPKPQPRPVVVNRSPVITGVSGPTTLKVGEQGVWEVIAYDPDGDYLTYSVEWGDEPVYALEKASSASAFVQNARFSHIYSKPGTYTIRFTVRDSKGAQNYTELTVYVEPKTYYPPTPTPDDTDGFCLMTYPPICYDDYPPAGWYDDYYYYDYDNYYEYPYYYYWYNFFNYLNPFYYWR